MRSAFDPEAALRRAMETGRLADAAREAAPRFAQYERLREALAQYRVLAGHPAWKSSLPPLPPGDRGSPPKLEPGQPYAGAPLLRERLVALGDLPASTATSAIYDEALADGVRAFQQRHGLTTDGVIGKATLAQLQVPPAARVRQLELMLERLRWTPLMQGPRMVVINIPEFVLRAYEVQGERIVVRQTMKIIVGKALNTRTPLFVEQMRFIEFQPFWNVPPSIARGEVVPRLRRDPGLLGPRRLRVRRRQPRGDRPVADAARRGARGPRAHPPAARAEERARRHQVRVPEQRQHLPASHAVGAAVRARPARLQPRLHPRRAAGRPCRVRHGGHARVDRGPHPSGDE